MWCCVSLSSLKKVVGKTAGLHSEAKRSTFQFARPTLGAFLKPGKESKPVGLRVGSGWCLHQLSVAFSDTHCLPVE